MNELTFGIGNLWWIIPLEWWGKFLLVGQGTLKPLFWHLCQKDGLFIQIVKSTRSKLLGPWHPHLLQEVMGWSTFSCTTVNWPSLWISLRTSLLWAVSSSSFIFLLPNEELGQEELSVSLHSQEEKHKTITLRQLGDGNDKNEPQAVSSTNFGTTLPINPFFPQFLDLPQFCLTFALGHSANRIVFLIVQKLFESRIEGSEHLFPLPISESHPFCLRRAKCAWEMARCAEKSNGFGDW